MNGSDGESQSGAHFTTVGIKLGLHYPYRQGQPCGTCTITLLSTHWSCLQHSIIFLPVILPNMRFDILLTVSMTVLLLKMIRILLKMILMIDVIKQFEEDKSNNHIYIIKFDILLTVSTTVLHFFSVPDLHCSS